VSEDLERVNEEWNCAWLARDAATVERIAAEDYVYLGPQGQVLDKGDILAIIRSPSYRLARGRWDEVTIGELGPESALILDRFRGHGEYRGRVFVEDHRHTSVWVRRESRWRVRLEHCSAITSD
jgi:ketosteroid isomerase-like protein